MASITSTPAQTISKDGWIAVLRIATMWEMNKIRRHAIDVLTGMSLGSIEKIVLAKKFHIPEWLRAGYSELAWQPQMLSLSECKEIDVELEWALRLYQVRESRLQQELQRYRGYGQSRVLTVEEAFAEEIAEEVASDSTYSAN
ncbi:hypothetical protein H0H92_003742 [Tricholoma furcatifolium]|nr:hypothetical protein H0H92_003742 [Tricholoma furcatifolium]